MNYPVIVCGLEDAIRNLPRLFTKAGFILEKSQQVLVKPNVCGLYHPSLKLISLILKYLSQHTRSLVIGETESMMHDPEAQFKRLGINSVLRRFGEAVRAVDLSNGKWIKIKVPSPHVLGEFNLPRMVVDSNILVNVPKAGTHPITGLTCALKNLFGLLPQKRKHRLYHPLGMDEVIADIAQVMRPCMNVVDSGDRVILGVDPLAVDVIACGALNLNPLDVKHLRLVSRDRGVGLRDFIKGLRSRVVEV